MTVGQPSQISQAGELEAAHEWAHRVYDGSLGGVPLYDELFPIRTLDYSRTKVLDVGAGPISVFEPIAPEGAAIVPYDTLAREYNKLLPHKKFAIRDSLPDGRFRRRRIVELSRSHGRAGGAASGRAPECRRVGTPLALRSPRPAIRCGSPSSRLRFLVAHCDDRAPLSHPRLRLDARGTTLSVRLVGDLRQAPDPGYDRATTWWFLKCATSYARFTRHARW